MDGWRNKSVWGGTTRAFPACTFYFKESPDGLFRVHAYQYDKKYSTFIVECTEETWKHAGLDRATEDDTLGYCEHLFGAELDGHKLLNNRSLWRSLPTIRTQRSHHANLLLMGDPP